MYRISVYAQVKQSPVIVSISFCLLVVVIRWSVFIMLIVMFLQESKSCRCSIYFGHL